MNPYPASPLQSLETAATMEPSTESIRELVRRTLDDLGLADAQPIGESLLTLGGYYVGLEFRFTGVRVVWMASQEQIKLYSYDGAVWGSSGPAAMLRMRRDLADGSGF
jgi:hypothetical protein